MHKPQQQVRELHEAIEHPRPSTFTALSEKRLLLRLKLIGEEMAELFNASGCDPGVQPDDDREMYVVLPYVTRRGFGGPAQSTTQQIDALCDLLVVTFGMAVEMGVDLEPFFDEVHRANMAKVGGPVREDGKRLKPPGWTPPDIAGVFERLYGESK